MVAGPLVKISYLSGQPSSAAPWRNGCCCLTPTRAQLGPKSQKFLSTGLFWSKALLGYYLYCVQVVVALRADLDGEVEDLAMVTSVLAVVHIKDNICPIPTQVRYWCRMRPIITDDVLYLGVVIIYKAGFCVYSTCAPLCHKVNLKTSSRLHNVKFTSPLLTQNHPQFSWRIKWHGISRRGGNRGHGGSAGF